MSEKRTSQQIQQEHCNLALKAGNLAYQVAQTNKEIEMIYNAMRDLSLEFVKVKQAEAEEAKAAEAAKAVAAPETKQGESNAN